MAVRTGISKPMLSKIENAQTSCSPTTVARLADALDVPVTSLFRGADTPREAVFTPAGAGTASPAARCAPATRCSSTARACTARVSWPPCRSASTPWSPTGAARGLTGASK
ncbi:helix-turn-helix transcriptional regulator [Pseudonocardia kujensis]|uniref:helix-turn-helix domain-containing protein n=1 Tax=Pseudonocardia kujensis TaxID=1128675 RepID=UPI001E645F49|nr:helix-turn-helix transcriptional regulator [Pseudonocardia kujensis]MCE0768621.1 helix-turn-helix transcriptional regulator [Pseudonocardia kujensis]